MLGGKLMFNQNPAFYSTPQWGNNQILQPSYGLRNNMMIPFQGTGMGLKKTGLAGINWGSLLNNTQRTLNVINQAIPVYNQIKPIWNNAKTMLRLFGEFSKLNATNTLATDQLINTTKAINNNDGPSFFA